MKKGAGPGCGSRGSPYSALPPAEAAVGERQHRVPRRVLRLHVRPPARPPNRHSDRLGQTRTDSDRLGLGYHVHPPARAPGRLGLTRTRAPSWSTNYPDSDEPVRVRGRHNCPDFGTQTQPAGRGRGRTRPTPPPGRCKQTLSPAAAAAAAAPTAPACGDRGGVGEAGLRCAAVQRYGRILKSSGLLAPPLPHLATTTSLTPWATAMIGVGVYAGVRRDGALPVAQGWGPSGGAVSPHTGRALARPISAAARRSALALRWRGAARAARIRRPGAASALPQNSGGPVRTRPLLGRRGASVDAALVRPLSASRAAQQRQLASTPQSPFSHRQGGGCGLPRGAPPPPPCQRPWGPASRRRPAGRARP
jgi:hypothetical protein